MGKKNRALRIFLYLVFIVFGIILLLICANILNIGFSFSSVLFLVLLVGVIWVIVRKKRRIFLYFRTHKKVLWIICGVLIVLSVVARLMFLFIGDRINIGDVLSDTGVHWYGAQEIVENGVVGSEVGEYENIYPYLASYTTILSLAMNMFGKSVAAIIVSNLIFDVISCVALYLIFSNWKKSKYKGLLAATLWAINPLEIIFCSMPLAIVLVNMLMIVSIALVYFYFKLEKRKILFYVLAFAVGALLAIGNAFRPIFIVALIAVLLYSVALVLKGEKGTKPVVLGAIIMCVAYFIVGLLPSMTHARINPYYNGDRSSAAWSLYVGANYKTEGKWNSDDRDEFFGSVLEGQAKGDIKLAQTLIMKKGLARYKEMIFRWQVVPHFINKIGVLFGDVQNSIYDLPYVYNFSSENGFYKILQDIILVYYYGLIGVLIYCLISKKRGAKLILVKEMDFCLFLMILFVGLVVASLLVEVMNRYSLPLIVVFYIMTLGLALPNKKQIL